MLSAARLASALALVAALIGLPMASVLCDVVCPTAQAQGHLRRDARAPRLEPIHAAAACHDAGQDEASTPAQTHGQPEAATATPISHASPGHGCDHPTVATAPSPSAGTRMLPAPTLAAFRVAAFDARVTRVSAAAMSPDRVAGTRARAAGAFSPVLRI